MKKRILRKIVKKHSTDWWKEISPGIKKLVPPGRWNNRKVVDEAARFYGANQ